MEHQDRATIADWLEYLLVRTIEAFLVSFPWRVGRQLASCVGDIVRVLDRPSRKERMVRDIKDAFPEFTGAQVSALIQENYRFLAASVVDAMNFIRFACSGKGDDLLEVQGSEALEGVSRRTGLIFVTGHFGYWELLGGASTAIGYPVASLARPSSNPLLEGYVRKLRESAGQRILEKRGSMRRAIRALRAGQNLAFLIDQDARRYGIFVDFLGKPASTVTSVARLSIYIGAPVVFVYARRIKGLNRFRIVFKDVIVPRKGAEESAEVLRITQRFTKDLEDIVRQWPGEWLWLHRRWKTYPGKYPGKTPAGLKSPAAGEKAGSQQRQASSPPTGSGATAQRLR